MCSKAVVVGTCIRGDETSISNEGENREEQTKNSKRKKSESPSGFSITVSSFYDRLFSTDLSMASQLKDPKADSSKPAQLKHSNSNDVSIKEGDVIEDRKFVIPDSATGETYTKRYQVVKFLGKVCRFFLLFPPLSRFVICFSSFRVVLQKYSCWKALILVANMLAKSLPKHHWKVKAQDENFALRSTFITMCNIKEGAWPLLNTWNMNNIIIIIHFHLAWILSKPGTDN